MDENQAQAGQDVLPQQERERAQTALIRAAGSGMVYYAATMGVVCTLFLLSMGASSFHIGIAATLFAVSPLWQLAGLQLLGKVGKARMGAYGKLASLAPLGFLIVLAASGRPGPPAVALAIAAYAVMVSLSVVGNTGWWPLLQDNTKGGAMGRFFARMRTRLRLVEVLLPMAVGWYLGGHPPGSKFTLPFVLGAAAMLAGAYFMLKIPERPDAAKEIGLFLRLRLAARARSIRPYLTFVGLYGMMLGLATPFWVVMLEKGRHLPVNYIVWIVAVAAVGNVVGLKTWGNLVDRHGGRALMGATLAAEAVLGLAWLFLPVGQAAMVVWGVCFYAIWGFLEGGCLMGRTAAMMKAVPAVYQADGFTLVTLAGGAGGSLGSLLGGFCFDWLIRHPRFLAPLEATTLYLALSQLGLLAAWLMRSRLAGHHQQTPARLLLAAGFRRLLGRSNDDFPFPGRL